MSAADAAVVNPSNINTHFWPMTSVNGSPTFSNTSRSLPRNLNDCIILDSCVFDNITSFHELLAKALRRPVAVY